MRNKKGSVLVQVLITSIIVVVIAMGLAQMLLLRYTATIRATKGTASKREAEGTLNRLAVFWAANGYCANPGGGLTCSGVTATCNACTCTLTAIAPATINGTVTAAGTYPNCSLTLNSTQ